MSSNVPNKTDVSNPTQRRSPSPHSAKPGTHGATNGVPKRSPPKQTIRGGAKGKSLRKVKKVIKKAGNNNKKARPTGNRKAGSTGKRIRNGSRNAAKKFNFF
ncbi:hypothetical protein RvY_05355 [Ramazzottius varieornatus]|uniref:Uncharacterized protein n=1 Tax=Ramazzottius varieornatus TaxID=947166 RepID=A0A1D1V1F5_RAMVA|nr:hypothetical protein RvY_05355 [Ramazzottius varieornatus]